MWLCAVAANCWYFVPWCWIETEGQGWYGSLIALFAVAAIGTAVSGSGRKWRDLATMGLAVLGVTQPFIHHIHLAASELAWIALFVIGFVAGPNPANSFSVGFLYMLLMWIQLLMVSCLLGVVYNRILRRWMVKPNP